MKLASHFLNMGSIFICQTNLGKQSIKFHIAYQCLNTNMPRHGIQINLFVQYLWPYFNPNHTGH